MFPVISLRMLCCLSLSVAITTGQDLSTLRQQFEHPPDNAKMMVRWWWFGPAVTKPELEREMRAMKAAGIGGFEVQPVYPLSVDDPQRGIRNLRYLSPEFLDALQFTGAKAKELGLRMDLTLGSGWPFGGPYIPAALASSKLRIERVECGADAANVSVPILNGGESFIAAFLVPAGADGFLPDAASLTDVKNGVAHVPAGKGSRILLFFIASRTRQMVKRAAFGAEGFVLDHYDKTAVETHLRNAGEPMLSALSATPPYAMFSDSLEVYGADWTGHFLEKFRNRRGYDLLPYLPALAGGSGEKTLAIRHDWGKTLTELADEEYLGTMEAFAKQHNTRFRSQTYGTPPVNLSSNSIVDLPEGEGWQWHDFSTTRWASSAGHLYARNVISSETWTWLHSPVFRATPLDMKAEADRHFLQGINQLVGHGWPYSPPNAGEPGWHFYAAAALNAHNPWWPVMPDVAAYVQRVSYMLRQGRPVTDVAIYLPSDEAWAGFSPGRVSLNQRMALLIDPSIIHTVLDAGYNFDFIDNAAINKVGIPHRALILPNVERIDPQTYKRIREFAERGGTVIAFGRTPSLAPGLKEDSAAIANITQKLFAGKDARGRNANDAPSLASLLKASVPVDVVRAPQIGFVHRTLPNAEIYFLANTSNERVHAPGTFREDGLSAAWWNPLNGTVSPAGDSRSNTIDLDLAPYESKILVFSKASTPARDASSCAATAPITLSSGWQVAFPGDIERPLTELLSWTSMPGRRFYSGIAIYQTTVTVPAAALACTRPVYLLFGDGTPVTNEPPRAGSGMRAMLESPVRDAAVVSVNGTRAGSVWCAPFQVEIGKLLHPGSNTISVVVANTAINELAGQPPRDYKQLNARYGERFQPQDMNHLEPLPSGLLQRVRVVFR